MDYSPVKPNVWSFELFFLKTKALRSKSTLTSKASGFANGPVSFPAIHANIDGAVVVLRTD